MADAQQARRVIEGLRSGIPYREMAHEIVLGRENQIALLNRMMDLTGEGHRPKFPAVFLRASYGQGKTHLMQSYWGSASDRNWVVSYVSLSKETPIDRMDLLYPKIIASTYVPGAKFGSMSLIVDQALSRSQVLAEARAQEFSPRAMAVLDNLVTHNEGYSELLQDVSGTFLPIGRLKQLYRANFNRPLKISNSPMRDEAYEYLRLTDALIRWAGYAGWLILFDEVELIGKLGKGARARSYASIGRILDLAMPGTLSSWALASNFLTDVVHQRNDQEIAPAWLQSRSKTADDPLVNWCRQGIDALIESKPLDPLSRQQIDGLLEQIYLLHQDAYAWRPPQSLDGLIRFVHNMAPAQDTRIRTYVRLSLTILDIWFQYGVNPTIRVGNVEDEDLAEEASPAPESATPAQSVFPVEGGQNAFEQVNEEGKGYVRFISHPPRS